jgi:hypothetical protein
MTDMTRAEYEKAKEYYRRRLENSGGTDHFEWLRSKYKLHIRWSEQRAKIGTLVRITSGSNIGHQFVVTDVKREIGINPYVYGVGGERVWVTNVEPVNPDPEEPPKMWGNR